MKKIICFVFLIYINVIKKKYMIRNFIVTRFLEITLRVALVLIEFV